MRTTASVFAASVLLLFSCGGSSERQQQGASQQRRVTADGHIVFPGDSPQLAQLRIEKVVAQPVPTNVVEAPGKVEVNPSRVSRVVLPVTGHVTDVTVKPGDAVKASQPILTMESPDADAMVSGLMQAEAAVAEAKVALAKAQADYDRSNDLYQHSAVAQKEVLNAGSIRLQSEAALGQADAARRQAAARLDILGLEPGKFKQPVRVRAPMSGKVLEVVVAPGEYRNDTNAPVITIADLSTVWISADVPESAIRFIDVGERVDIELTAYPGEIFRGRVTRIADTVDPQTRAVKVRAELNNPGGRLRPEMFARVRHTDSLPVLPVVPSSALVQEQGRNIVYREDSRGVFSAVTVRTGEPFKGMIPILEGLRPGDRIVAGGVMLLKTT
jgi:membrane fusion protein, heavy metal efflux system